MYRSTTRWPIAAAAAALLALPGAAAAQTQTTAPPQNPTQPPQQQQQPDPQQPTTPPQTQPPTQPPAQQPPAASASQPAEAGQVDAATAKQHLSAARESLSQLTSLPEASKLQGDSRTQVSELISNFNELITTQANWRASYDKVDANLAALIGPDATDASAASGTAGAVGTSGSSASTLDPAIRAKLVDFRTHMKAFREAAGGSATEPRNGDTTGAMPPASATGSTSNPSNPASNPTAANPAQPTSAGATGTSGVTTSPTGSMNPADQARAADQVNRVEADKHLQAISDILEQSKNGALTKEQTTELKKHVDELRKLIGQ
jgi:hypothetical protein